MRSLGPGGFGGAEDLKSVGCWVSDLLPSPSAPVAAEHVGIADKCYCFSFKCYIFSLWLLAAPLLLGSLLLKGLKPTTKLPYRTKWQARRPESTRCWVAGAEPGC